MKKPDRECTTIRKTPLHVPDTGARIRQGLSHMFDAPTIPEEVACSSLSPITCFQDRQPCPPMPLWGWRQLPRWLQQHGGSSPRQHW
jgi:hypothetical protein